MSGDWNPYYVAGDWNPYYVAYATANGRTPADQLAHDKAARPHPRGKYQPRDHAGYGRWLAHRWGTEVTA